MTLCDHLKADTWPLRIDQVFATHLTFAEALVSCTVCQQAYLLELLDVRNAERLFRVSVADQSLTTALLHNLNRGSCDLERARAEFDHFRLQCQRLNALLWLDTSGPILVGVVTTDSPLPVDCWHDLPCDSRWFDKLDL